MATYSVDWLFARLAERTRDLLMAGLNLYIMWMMPAERIFTPRPLDDFASFYRKSCDDPAFRGQYRVVLSDGTLVSAGDIRHDDCSNIIPSHMRTDTPGKMRLADMTR